MVDTFWKWLWHEFRPSILETIGQAVELVARAALHIIAWILLIAVLVTTAPFWTPLFIYWYFAKWRKREDEEDGCDDN